MIGTSQSESVQLAFEYELEARGINSGSGCSKHRAQGAHWTQQRSLPVSTMAENCCGGVPREICSTYSPLPADTWPSKLRAA